VAHCILSSNNLITGFQNRGGKSPPLEFHPFSMAHPQGRASDQLNDSKKSIITLRDIAIQMNSKRKAALKPMRGAGTAWLDQDNSGNYDPEAERRRRPATPSRRTKKSKTGVNEDVNPRPTRELKRSRYVGYSFPMTFKFTTDKGLTYLRSITPGPLSDAGSLSEGVSKSDLDECGSPKSSYKGRRRTRRNRKSKVECIRWVCLLF
jgi:hypothetical protein